jgi:hypothetical protein
MLQVGILSGFIQLLLCLIGFHFLVHVWRTIKDLVSDTCPSDETRGRGMTGKMI